MHLFKFLPVLILFVLSSCNNQPASNQNAQGTQDGVVDVEAFEKLSLSQDVQLIDVRTPEEFSAGYIPNAKNINFRDSNFKQQILSLDKNKPVLLYCKSGGRSGKSYKLFKGEKFETVYDLKGGFTAWSSANKAISK